MNTTIMEGIQDKNPMKKFEIIISDKCNIIIGITIINIIY